MHDSDSDRHVALGPSVLAADFLRLGQQLAEIEQAGADFIHYDVMDGRFVPNIALGLPELEAIRRGTTLPIDVHLMVVEPERWVEPFSEAGANSITFHAEAATHALRVVQAIVEGGCTAGVALNPGSPISAIEELLPHLDQVLVMTVNPGFGGQSFIPSMLDKITRLRQCLDDVNPGCDIQVDGGINLETIGGAVRSGATNIVAGTAIINDERSIAENVSQMRAAIASQTVRARR